MAYTAVLSVDRKTEVTQFLPGREGLGIAAEMEGGLAGLLRLGRLPVDSAFDGVADADRRGLREARDVEGNVEHAHALRGAPDARGAARRVVEDVGEGTAVGDGPLGRWFAVEDGGPAGRAGVPEDELPLITEKYYRGRDVKEKTGYGLGLYLVKLYMEMYMEKFLLVESIPGLPLLVQNSIIR